MGAIYFMLSSFKYMMQIRKSRIQKKGGGGAYLILI